VIQELVGALAAMGVDPRPPVMLLRSVLRTAAQLGVVEEVPAFPRVDCRVGRLPKVPSDDEVYWLVRRAKGWVKVAIAIGAYAGLASREVRPLEVRDVHLDRSELTVRRILSDDREESLPVERQRIEPIAESLRPILRRAMEGRPPAERIVSAILP
jgi:integrase